MNASTSGTQASRAPLVSIAMPAYNAAKTIACAIESVLAQTMTNFELVICDDASTDATAVVVAGFSDPRIKLLRNELNLGEGASRDNAIAAAEGQWLAVLDADDAWLPQRLARLLAAAEGDIERMVFDDLMKCHDTPAGLVAWEPLRGTSPFGVSAGDSHEVTVATFVRSQRLLIKPLIPADFVSRHGIKHSGRKFGADTEFFLALMAHGARLRYVPEPMYLYRLTPGSATANPQRHRLMRESVEAFVTHPGFSEEEREALRFKVARLRRNETYATFVEATRGGRLAESMRLLVSNPWILPRMIRRLVRGARYNADRERHGGRGRDAAL